MAAKPKRKTRRPSKEVRELNARCVFLRKLLGEFGAQLSGFDPGVSAWVAKSGVGDGYWGETLSFNRLEWNWIEPLLVELRDARRKANR